MAKYYIICYINHIPIKFIFYPSNNIIFVCAIQQNHEMSDLKIRHIITNFSLNYFIDVRSRVVANISQTIDDRTYIKQIKSIATNQWYQAIFHSFGI